MGTRASRAEVAVLDAVKPAPSVAAAALWNAATSKPRGSWMDLDNAAQVQLSISVPTSGKTYVTGVCLGDTMAQVRAQLRFVGTLTFVRAVVPFTHEMERLTVLDERAVTVRDWADPVRSSREDGTMPRMTASMVEGCDADVSEAYSAALRSVRAMMARYLSAEERHEIEQLLNNAPDVEDPHLSITKCELLFERMLNTMHTTAWFAAVPDAAAAGTVAAQSPAICRMAACGLATAAVTCFTVFHAAKLWDRRFISIRNSLHDEHGLAAKANALQLRLEELSRSMETLHRDAAALVDGGADRLVNDENFMKRIEHLIAEAEHVTSKSKLLRDDLDSAVTDATVVLLRIVEAKGCKSIPIAKAASILGIGGGAVLTLTAIVFCALCPPGMLALLLGGAVVVGVAAIAGGAMGLHKTRKHEEELQLALDEARAAEAKLQAMRKDVEGAVSKMSSLVTMLRRARDELVTGRRGEAVAILGGIGVTTAEVVVA